VSTDDEIRAAGGIVWRRNLGALRIALVRRVRYGGDVALPKGKLHQGETWRQAALREVREETGCPAELGPYAGDITYTVEGRRKLVRFWHMRPSLPCRPPALDEVQHVLWVTMGEAQEMMSYSDEFRLLAQAWECGATWFRGGEDTQ